MQTRNKTAGNRLLRDKVEVKLWSWEKKSNEVKFEITQFQDTEMVDIN